MSPFAGFDWDAGNREKCERHGVPATEIEHVFHGVVAVHPDPEHSVAEQRYKAIGRTAGGRHVFVVFAIRRRAGKPLIRPISARYMHRREVEHYEAEAARSAQRRGG